MDAIANVPRNQSDKPHDRVVMEKVTIQEVRVNHRTREKTKFLSQIRSTSS